jgi:transposase-like protein
MILNALVERLQRRSKHGFKGCHFVATLILQAVSWYLRYPLSYRDIEELFRERGLAVDHSTLNRWVLTYAPLIEKRLRPFRKPQCGSIRIDETYIKIRGQWRYLYRAIDKHGTPVDFLLTATRDLDAAKRFFRKALQDQPLLSPDRIGTRTARAPIQPQSQRPGRTGSWRACQCITSPSTRHAIRHFRDPMTGHRLATLTPYASPSSSARSCGISWTADTA